MARQRVIRTPRALQDLAAQVEYLIVLGEFDAAERFLLAVEAALEKLEAHPLIGPSVPVGSPRLRGVRFWLVPGFPSHLIYYRASDASVVILRILHAARDRRGLLE